MAKKTKKLPWMKFFPGDWSKDPALTLCTPATRGIWIDLICAMHELDQSGELRGTTDQLARFARCTTVEFVQAMTELQTNRAADVTERNGVYRICNRRMSAAYKLRKSIAIRVQRHRDSKSNAGCNGEETPQRLEGRGQNIKNPPPPNQSASPESDPWKAVEEDLLNFGVFKASDAIQAVRGAGCNLNQVHNLIEFWRSRKPAWDVGALYERLIRFRPDQSFDALWPPQSSSAAQQTARAQNIEKQRQASEERKKVEAQHQADKLEADRLEKQFGHKLDELPRSAVRKLVAEIYPENPPFMLQQLPTKGPPTGFMRYRLLQEIQKRHEESTVS